MHGSQTWLRAPSFRCPRAICFFAHSPEELRQPSYPSLNAEQLEALFTARASLQEEDDKQLERTLRSCILGKLPLLPQCADAIAGTAGYAGASHAGPALATAACGGVGAGGSRKGVAAEAPAGSAHLLMYGSPYLAVSSPLAIGASAMPRGLSADGTYPMMLAGGAIASSGMTYLPVSAACGLTGPFAEQYGALPMPSQQQDHNLMLSNLYKIQILRDQLQVAEQAALAGLKPARAGYVANVTGPTVVGGMPLGAGVMLGGAMSGGAVGFSGQAHELSEPLPILLAPGSMGMHSKKAAGGMSCMYGALSAALAGGNGVPAAWYGPAVSATMHQLQGAAAALAAGGEMQQ